MRPDSGNAVVDLAAIQRAAERLDGVARRTPLVPFRGGLVKPESLQVTGSFKFRGAYNAIATELEEGDVAGVVAHSSGNHAQGVAYAARLLSVSATAVMPANAPAIKRHRAASYGATIVDVGPNNEERVQVAERMRVERDLVLISSTEHSGVIAGQGTVGLEIAESLLNLPAVGDQIAAGRGEGVEVYVPIGGGGLASGVGVAVRSLLPKATVIGVEPALAADAHESLDRGEIVRWGPERVTRTVADGLRHTSLGPLSFMHLREVIDRVVTVSERQILQAVAALAWDARLVAEPSGAVAAAGHLADERPVDGERYPVCVLSGGNVDGRAYARWLTESTERGDIG